MGIPLVALQGRSPEITDPQTIQMNQARIQALRGQNALQPGELQEQQQRIEANKRQLEQQQAVNDAYKGAMTVDPQGQPSIDTNKLSQALSLSGHGSAVPGILESVTSFQKSKQALVEQGQKIQEGQADLLGHAAFAIKQAKYDPNVAHTILNELPDSPQIKNLRQIIDSNPQQFQQIVDTAIAQSPAQQKEQTTLDAAKIRAAGSGKEGELPLTASELPQANKLLANQFLADNPGKAVPAEFVLPQGATQKDYQRVSDSLKATSSVTDRKAQQEVSNEMKRTQLAISQQAHADAQAQHASKPVLAFDADNKSYLLPEGDAKAQGLKGITEATPKQIDDAKTHTVVLNTMQTKLNDVVAARGALDQGATQRAIISKVLSHAEPGMLNDAIKNMALSGATPQTKEYIQSVLQLKETSLGLPKEITGGSRTSETQSSALFQTLPSGASVDGKYALGQAKKFQADIDRLRERVPNVRGLAATAAHPDMGGQSAPAQAAAPAKPAAATHTGIGSMDKKKHWLDANGKDLGLAE